MKDYMHVWSVTLSVESKALKYVISTAELTKFEHDLVADIYGGFLRTLSTPEGATATAAALLNEKKEQLLYNVLFTEPGDSKLIYDSNPDIEMVHDAFLLGIAVADYDGRVGRAKMPYMTMRTWSSIYEPLYTEAISFLIADGICAVGFSIPDFVDKKEDAERGLTTISDPGTADLYENHIRDMLRQEMKKLYCRRMAAGSELSLTAEFKSNL